MAAQDHQPPEPRGPLGAPLQSDPPGRLAESNPEGGDVGWDSLPPAQPLSHAGLPFEGLTDGKRRRP